MLVFKNAKIEMKGPHLLKGIYIVNFFNYGFEFSLFMVSKQVQINVVVTCN